MIAADPGCVVVDASLAARWVLPEPYAVEATALLAQWERDGVRRLVPLLFLSEISSPLLRRRRAGLITPEDSEMALSEVLLAVTLWPEDAALAVRARAIADANNVRNAYDCLYTALAEREACEFWTGDERFYNATHRQLPRVRWVGEVR